MVQDSKRSDSKDSGRNEKGGDLEIRAKEDGDVYYPGQENEGRFGWFGFTPDWLQFINNPTGYLCVYSMFLITQGMLVNGLLNAVITTLERRFGFQSSETGLIVVSYDIAYFALCLFVTFYGNRAHGPRLLGVGAIVFGIGTFVFSLPHFTTGKYEYEGDVSDLCNPEFEPQCENTEGNEKLHAYLGVFIVAMLLQGVGCIPLYTVGFAVIENSCPKGQASLYIAIANATSILGPVLGFMIGGYLLTVYVDFDTTPSDEITLTPDDPRWVGAWWVGFLLATGMAWILVSIPMLGFPKHMPGSAKVRALKESEVHAKAGGEITETEDFGKSIKDLPVSILAMMRNPTFLFTTFAGCSEGFIVSAFTAFLPKFIENQFNLTAGLAAACAGAIAIPGGIIGNVMAGVLMQRFDMRTPQILKMCIAAAVAVFILTPVALLHCDNPTLAGVTVAYDGSPDTLTSANLSSSCNENCNCQEKYFAPVCGSNNVTYFSACIAGCDSQESAEGQEGYSGCSCLEDRVVSEGFCENECSKLGPFLAIFFIIVLLNFTITAPALLVTLRCVPDSQKPFAVGLQWFVVRALGSIPGPIVFGVVFDSTCLLWQQLPCGSERGSCWFHNSDEVAYYLLIPGLGCKALSATFFSLALHFYKPVKETVYSSEVKENGAFEPYEGDNESTSATSSSANGRNLIAEANDFDTMTTEL